MYYKIDVFYSAPILGPIHDFSVLVSQFKVDYANMSVSKQDINNLKIPCWS